MKPMRGEAARSMGDWRKTNAPYAGGGLVGGRDVGADVAVIELVGAA